jgi:hypothetical protein
MTIKIQNQATGRERGRDGLSQGEGTRLLFTTLTIDRMGAAFDCGVQSRCCPLREEELEGKGEQGG